MDRLSAVFRNAEIGVSREIILTALNAAAGEQGYTTVFDSVYSADFTAVHGNNCLLRAMDDSGADHEELIYEVGPWSVHGGTEFEWDLDGDPLNFAEVVVMAALDAAGGSTLRAVNEQLSWLLDPSVMDPASVPRREKRPGSGP